MAKNLTLEVLKAIRDEVRRTNERLDRTNERLDQTNERLDRVDSTLNKRIDDLRDELSRRIVESEMRTATALTALAGDGRELTSFLRNMMDLRPRVEKCEQEIEALKRRMPDA